MEEITQMISNVGFPIVACVFMAWFINTTLKDFTNTMRENTNMLSKLCEKLDDIQEVKEVKKK